MTEEQIKEAISREFLRMLAHSHGFKVTEPNLDHGVDMSICHVSKRIEPQGRVRYLDSPYRLDIQLKATTVAGLIDDVDSVKFDLEVKNYNDLVHRRDELLPLHLVVVALNSPPPDCVNLSLDELGLACRAYWFLPLADAAPSENVAQIRITIPKANQLSKTFVPDRFAQFGVDL